MALTRRAMLGMAMMALAPSAAPAAGAAGGAARYPQRAVRLIVPYPAGGPSDIVARAVAERLGARLGKSFVVDNRPGANGVIGNQAVAAARPDGYTLLLTLDSSLTVNPSLYGGLPYDPIKSFAPVALVADNVNVLVVNRASPATSAAQFVALARQSPQLVSMGGTGTPSHLAAELLRRQTGAKLTIVPYKGSPPALLSVLSGEVQATFAAVSAALPHAGTKLRVLAVASPRRTPVFPDVPTMREAGIAGVETDGWFGLLAPAGTPADVRARLNRSINEILRMPDMRELLLRQGISPLGGTPEQMAARMATESKFWAGLIADAGIRAE